MADLNPSSVVDFRNSPDFGHIIQSALESPWGTTRGGVGATQYIDDSQKSELTETFIRHYTRDLDTADKALDHLAAVLAHLGQPGAAFDKRTRARELIAKLRLWMRNNMLYHAIRGGDSAPLQLRHTEQSIDQIKELGELGASLHAAWREAWNAHASVVQSQYDGHGSPSKVASSDDGEGTDEDFEADMIRLTDAMREILVALGRAYEKGSALTRDQLIAAVRANNGSAVDRAIQRMRKPVEESGFGLTIENDASGSGYVLRGRALRMAQALLRKGRGNVMTT